MHGLIHSYTMGNGSRYHSVRNREALYTWGLGGVLVFSTLYLNRYLCMIMASYYEGYYNLKLSYIVLFPNVWDDANAKN